MVKCAGVFLQPRDTTDTIEVLRERVENAATGTFCNNRGMLKRVEESFRRRLHYCFDITGGHFENFL
jgi:hypothetical protein